MMTANSRFVLLRATYVKSNLKLCLFGQKVSSSLCKLFEMVITLRAFADYMAWVAKTMAICLIFYLVNMARQYKTKPGCSISSVGEIDMAPSQGVQKVLKQSMNNGLSKVNIYHCTGVFSDKEGYQKPYVIINSGSYKFE